MRFVVRNDIVSDFDLMLMRKKEEIRKRKKRRRDVDIINDNDDLIADMIVKMKEAAEVTTVLSLNLVVYRNPIYYTNNHIIKIVLHLNLYSV